MGNGCLDYPVRGPQIHINVEGSFNALKWNGSASGSIEDSSTSRHHTQWCLCVKKRISKFRFCWQSL